MYKHNINRLYTLGIAWSSEPFLHSSNRFASSAPSPNTRHAPKPRVFDNTRFRRSGALHGEHELTIGDFVHVLVGGVNSH